MNYLIPFLVQLLSYFSISQSKLVFVYSHIRHGTRGPGFGEKNMSPIHKDIYNVEWEGNGEITKVGIRMLYLLGKITRKRYNSFLSTFDPLEIRVLSTSKSRTIMSGQAFIQGMFPITDHSDINQTESDLSMPPIELKEEDKNEIKQYAKKYSPENNEVIPIHLLDKEENNMLLTDKSVCPKMLNYKNKTKTSKLFYDFYSKLNKTYGVQLRKYFNKTEDYFFILRNVFTVCDVFQADYANNRELSSFAAMGIDLDKFYGLCVELKTIYLFTGDCAEELSPMAVSKTFPKILSWMKKRVDIDMTKPEHYNKFHNPKFVIYTGHDKTIAPFELFMKKVFNTKLIYPKFGASLFIELHRDDKSLNRNSTIDDYYVKYYFNGEFLMEETYANFVSKVQNELMTDEQIKSFCAVEAKGNLLYIIIVGLFAIAIIISIGICAGIFGKKTNKKKKKNLENKNDEELIDIEK